MSGGAGERATLPRGERLRDGAAIDRLFRRGARIERPAFVLLWMPVAGRRTAAFTASRRLGQSVRRNRARRRLREAYRRVKQTVPVQGIRLCFVARPGAVDLAFPDLKAQVGEALQHAGRRLAS
jgi:ribonuclease P protein component